MLKMNRLSASLAAAVAAGAFGSLGAGAVMAQAAPGQELSRVEITGSSIRRVETEGALAVQAITREEIARSGVTSTEQLLNQLSAISSSGGTANATGAGASTYGLSAISMRGLGSDRTLILVNGRRVAAFAGGGGATVNVNNIPLAAIERVEVLKDGASAIYGSDAVAGVVNFILSRNLSGIDLSATLGTPTRSGGGQNQRLSVVGGWGDLNRDRYNITLSATVEREEALFAKDREFAKTGNQFPWLVAGATGLGNIEGSFTPGTGSVATGNWVEGTRGPGFGNSPGAGFGNPLAAANRCGEINMFRNPTPTSQGAPYCTFDSNAFVGLTPKREVTGLTANGAFKVNDSLELFGDALFSESIVTQAYQQNPVRRSFLITDALFQQQGVDPALLIFPTNPNYAIAANYLTAQGFGSLVGQPLAITSRVFDFGPRSNKDTSTQTRFVGGARGVVFGQDYELAASMNESKTSGILPSGYFSQVAYARIVQTSNDWNPWSLTQSPAFTARLPSAAYTGGTLEAKSKSTVLDGKLSGEAFKLPAGQAYYAAGFQLRDEKYTTVPSAAFETGDIAGLGGPLPPVDRSRKITALYGEAILPIVKSVEGTVAVRSDDYNDVGAASTYKAALRWQPTRGLLVRGSMGTGFRAPTLTDLWQPQTTGTSEQFTDPAFPNTTNLQVNAITGGNPQLRPETSRQNSVGLVVQPTQSLTFGVDYFRIKIKDIISQPSTQEVVSGFRRGDPAYAGLVTVNGSNEVDFVRVTLANTGSADVAGLDLEANYRDRFSFGGLEVNFSGTYMDKYNQTSPGGTTFQKVGTIVDANGDPVIGADEGGVILRWKHRLSATWLTGPWAFTLGQEFYKGYETGRRQIDGERNFVTDQALYDAQVAFTGVKNLRLALGVRNLFDKNPPIFVPASNQFQAGYDITQYDPRGRFVYVNLGYKF